MSTVPQRFIQALTRATGTDGLTRVPLFREAGRAGERCATIVESIQSQTTRIYV